MLFCCLCVADPATFLPSDSVLGTLFSNNNNNNNNNNKKNNISNFVSSPLLYCKYKNSEFDSPLQNYTVPLYRNRVNDENTKAHFLPELSKSGYFQFKTNAEGIWRLSQCAEQKQKQKKNKNREKKVLDFSRQESFYQLCIPLDVSVERVNTVKRVSKKTREGSRLPLITPPSPISAE